MEFDETSLFNEATVKLASRTGIIHHCDSIEWADAMDEWRTDPANKQKSKAGDDRTPPYRWIGHMYFDDPKAGVVTVPCENIMKCITEAARQVPTGRKQQTYGSLIQSGLFCPEFHWPLLVNGKPIPMTAINEIKKLKTFREHKEAAEDLGFSLYVRRVKIGNNKHIRVRPRFDKWTIEGKILIIDDAITKEILRIILQIAGRLKGLCDWRPGGRTPGPWGMFTSEVS